MASRRRGLASPRGSSRAPPGGGGRSPSPCGGPGGPRGGGRPPPAGAPTPRRGQVAGPAERGVFILAIHGAQLHPVAVGLLEVVANDLLVLGQAASGPPFPPAGQAAT